MIAQRKANNESLHAACRPRKCSELIRNRRIARTHHKTPAVTPRSRLLLPNKSSTVGVIILSAKPAALAGVRSEFLARGAPFYHTGFRLREAAYWHTPAQRGSRPARSCHTSLPEAGGRSAILTQPPAQRPLSSPSPACPASSFRNHWRHDARATDLKARR
jgi:hypothetical protein